MENSKKLLCIFLTSLLLIIMMSTTILASYSPDSFKSKIDTDSSTGNIKTAGGKIVGVIQVVGTIVSVGMLIVLGIKYMMGSAEERAEYKKTLFPYFVGAILIFAAGSLTQMIYTWASGI